MQVKRIDLENGYELLVRGDCKLLTPVTFGTEANGIIAGHYSTGRGVHEEVEIVIRKKKKAK